MAPPPPPPPVPGPDSSPDMQHFLAIPWCAAHLTKPGIIATAATSRTQRSSSTYDAFISRTVNTPDTIVAFATFHHPPSPEDSNNEETARPDELGAFITLGPGLDGYAGVCHGGMVAAIFDEAMGLVFTVRRLRGPGWGSYMTAYLNTTFLSPVRTPGTYMVVSRATRREGRKVTIEATMEDEQGRVLARAEALFVAVKSKM